jgi:hypothetical protein
VAATLASVRRPATVENHGRDDVRIICEFSERRSTDGTFSSDEFELEKKHQL